MPNRAFVTGGTGVVGSDLVGRLTDEGWGVSALVRSDAGAEAMAASGVKPVRGDVTSPEGLVDGMWGSDVVFHLAGVNKGCPRDPAQMDRVNIEGTVNVVAAAAEAGVGTVVHTSSVSAIGEGEGIVGTEHTRHGGEYVSAYARSKHLAEEAAFATAAERNVALVSVNPSSVQGPGRSTGSAELLLRALSSPRPRLFDTTFSIIDIADCSRGHILAATKGRSGERYILSGHTVSVGELIGIVTESTGRQINPRWVSEGVVRTIGGPAARLARLFGQGDRLCPDLIRTLLHGHRYDNTKSREHLGLEYTPLADTITRTIAWFESEGLLAT